MATVVIILFVVLSVGGIIGSIVPGLPGHPLNLIAMCLVGWKFQLFGSLELILAAFFAVVVFLLDYYIPIWTANRYGATRSGIYGSIIGMLLGMFFTPVGMIAGTFIGAVLGDLMAGKKTDEAAKSGSGTLLGTFVSIGFKLVYALIITIYVSIGLIHYYWK